MGTLHIVPQPQIPRYGILRGILIARRYLAVFQDTNGSPVSRGIRSVHPSSQAYEEIAPKPCSRVRELVHIPRELVNPRTSHHRLVIEIFINELSCEALIDLGASVSGMSLSFYQCYIIRF